MDFGVFAALRLGIASWLDRLNRQDAKEMQPEEDALIQSFFVFAWRLGGSSFRFAELPPP
jgi:hypothetical protein